MQIKEISVQGFRSVGIKTRLPLEPKITTIIGANESGKTNLIDAITKAGSLSNFEESDKTILDSGADKIGVEITISNVPQERIKEIIQQIRREINRFVSHLDTLSKEAISNERAEKSDVDINVVIADLRENIELIYSTLEKAALNQKGETGSVTVRVHSKGAIVSNIQLPEGDLTQRRIVGQTNHIYSKLGRLLLPPKRRPKKPSDTNKEQMVLYRNNIKKAIQDIDNFTLTQPITLAEALLDQISFTCYKGDMQVQDEATIENLKPGDFYYELFQFAEITPEKLKKLEMHSLREKRKNAEKKLTNLFNKYWDQEEVEFGIESVNNKVSLTIRNKNKHGRALSPDLPSYRSEGFRYFLSFFIKVLANSDDQLDNDVILIDDAGTHLHPNGQKDFRKALEKLARDNQVILATHSPFLINGDNTSEIRLVSRDNKHSSTEVLEKMSEYDAPSDDVLAPVRAVIGAGFADGLFANKKTILVEGTTDKQYLKAFCTYLDRSDEIGITGIDWEETAIIDSMSASKMHKYAKILQAEGYEFVCLFDADHEGKKQAEKLTSEHGIEEERVHCLSESISGSEDRHLEMEDLCSRNVVTNAVAEIHPQVSEDYFRSQTFRDSATIMNEISRLLHEEIDSEQEGDYKADAAEKISEWARDNTDKIDEATALKFTHLIADIKEKLGESVDADLPEIPDPSSKPAKQ